MNNYLKISFLGFAFIVQSIKPHNPKHATLLAAGAIVATAASYYYLRTPLTIDTQLDHLNVLTFTPKNSTDQITQTKSIHEICTNIQQDNGSLNEGVGIQIGDTEYTLSCDVPTGVTGNITINVSGYAGMSGNARYKYAGAGAYGTAKYIQNGLIQQGTCIAFDGQVNDRRSFNFGQQLDQQCLDTVIRAVIARNPEAKITLVGSCKGGTTILNYVADLNNKDVVGSIKAVLLESPSSSLEALSDQVAQNYLPTPLQSVLPQLFALVFPNYIWNQPTILDNANNFPDHLSGLIGCLPHDKVASHQDIRMIFDSLKQHGKRVELFTCHDEKFKHGHLSEDPQFQEKVKHFYRSI